jgi:hypothetical protein
VIHHCVTRLEWSGSTAGGHDAHDRGHALTAPPAEQELRLSPDRAFRGDPRRRVEAVIA